MPLYADFMSASTSAVGFPVWMWVTAIISTTVIVGVGLWVSITTGQWLALVLAIGLSAPIDVLLIRGISGPHRRADHRPSGDRELEAEVSASAEVPAAAEVSAATEPATKVTASITSTGIAAGVSP